MIDKSCQTEISYNNHIKKKAKQYEMDNKSMIDMTNKLNHNDVYDELEKSIHELEIYDVCLNNNKLLMRCNDKYYKTDDINVKQYEFKEVDAKYIMKKRDEMKYEEVNMNKYVPTKGYGNCEVLNNFYTNKIIIENGIGFKKPKNLKRIYYDIETYNCNEEYNQVPKCENAYSKIAMISMYVENRCIVYLSREYDYDENKIMNQLKTKISEEVQIEINVSENETIMCQEFIKRVQEYDTEQTTKLLIGFNSSMGKHQPRKSAYIYGYDLSFIMERSNYRYKTELKYGVKIYHSNEYRMVKKIDVMPSVYFVDMSILLYENIPREIKTMKNYKLDSYLELYKIGIKMDHDYVELQRRLNEREDDISDIISYCIYDCYALKLLDEKRKLIDDKLEMIEIMNLPMNFVLYETISKMLELSIIREYYNKGYICQYSKKYEEDKNKMKYKGAYTQSIKKEYQYKIQERASIADFESMFPNIIISNNMCLTNISYKNEIMAESETENQIDISEENKEIKMVSYSNDGTSVLNEYVSRLFKKRKEAKKQLEMTSDKYYDMLQMKYKLMINSLYGLFGSSNSILYNGYMASSITAYSRKLIKSVMEYVEKNGHEVIFIDTDSIVFRLGEITKLEEYNELLRGINGHINTIVKPDRRDILKMNPENIWLRAILPANKKSYIKLSCSIEDYFAGRYEKAETYVNGITWSVMHEEMSEEIKKLCKEIMNTINVDIKGMIDEWVKNMIDVMRDAVAKKNINTIKRFSKYIKLNKSSNSEYIRTVYKVEKDYVYVVKLKTEDKSLKSMMPVEDIRDEHYSMIDVLYHMTFITNQLKRFFEIDLDGSDQYNNILMKYNLIDDRSLITIREDYINDKNKMKSKYKQFDNVEELEKYIENNENRSIHELIMNEHKMYFDIDMSAENKFDIDGFIRYLQEQIGKNITYHIASASTDKKQSYHIVLDYICDDEYNKMIARDYNDKTRKNYCDIGVYVVNDKSSKTLRMLNTPKSDFKKNEMINRKFKIVSVSRFSDFIISNIENLNKNTTPYKYSDKEIIEIKKKNNMIDPKDSDLVKKYYEGVGIKIEIISNEKNRFYNIKMPDKNEYKCVLCDRIHEKDQHFFYVTKKNVVINCFRNASENKMNKIKLNRVSGVKDITIKDIYENMKENKTKSTMNKKDVEYEITSELTTVKSLPGTSKTTQMKKILQRKEYENKKILVLSFRRSFSNDFANKFSGIKMYNYMEIKGIIDNNNYNKVILQIDSLMRYKYSEIDLLVLDEIESIMVQMTSSQIKDRMSIMHEFRNICKVSKQILLLDACLMDSTVRFIKDISDKLTMTNVINGYKPKTEYTLSMNEFSNKNKKHLDVIYGRIKNEIMNKKKIIIFCTLNNFAHSMHEELKKLNNKILILSGRDMNINEEGVSMSKTKNEIFKNDINKVISEYDIFIYTSSLSAGVSIEMKHFDKCYVIYGESTCDVVSVYQGLHRARNLNDKYIEMYYEYHRKYEPITCAEYHDRYKHILTNTNDNVYNIDIYIQTRMNALNYYKTEMLMKYLIEDGYEMRFDDYGNKYETVEKFENNIQTIEKQARENFDKIEITKVDVELVEKISYNHNLNDEIIDREFELKSKIIWNCKILGLDPLTLKTQDRDKIQKLFTNIKDIKKIKKNRQMNVDEMLKALNCISDQVNNADERGTVLKNSKVDRLNEAKNMHDIMRAKELYEALKSIDFTEYVEKSVIENAVKGYCDKHKIDVKSDRLISSLNNRLKLINIDLEVKRKRVDKKYINIYKLNTNKYDV